jgi:hypothetical protein
VPVMLPAALSLACAQSRIRVMSVGLQILNVSFYSLHVGEFSQIILI